jgi:hypothetical protein
MENDTLKDARDEFKASLDNESEQRKASQDDLEFAKLEKQWDQRDIDQRREEGRPCLTINRLPSFIKHVTNDGRINRPAINVKPVGSGATKDTANILSDLVRNIETMSQADIVYDTAFDFAVSCGLGYFRVDVDYATEDEFEQDIRLSRISNPFSVYGDYESKEATSIDWNRAFVTEKYRKASFEAKFGKQWKAASFESGGGDYDDQNWFDGDGIRVAEYWTREKVDARIFKLSNGMVMFEAEMVKIAEALTAQGITIVGDRETKTHKVKQRILTGTDVIEENDWLGKYIPIVPMYGEEVNINGKRYFISLVRRAKDSQRNFNYWRTSATELVALSPKAPWVGPVGMFVTDHAKWQTANRVAHQYIEFDVVPGAEGMYPQRQPFAGVPAGALQEAANAQDDMKSIMNIYDASLGQRSNETSGRAINARDRQSDVATFDFIDNRNRAVEHGGRIIIDLIPKVYSAQRIMRCVQEDGTTYAVPVNQEVAPAQEVRKLQQPMPQPMPPQMGPMGPAPMGPGMPPQGPQGPMQGPMPPMGAPTQQEPQEEAGGPPEYVPVTPELTAQLPPEALEHLRKITKVFDLTTGKYDVTVTAGPGFATRREEASQQMMEFIRIFPQSAPLIGDLLAKNLDWPGAEQVAQRLKAVLPPQAAGQINPMVQNLQNMLQQQDAQAKQAIGQLQQQIGGLTKQVQDKQGELQIKAQEVQVKQFEAETRRAEVMKPEVMQPQQIDPFKAAAHELAEREMRVAEYNAETERLKVLGTTLDPVSIQALVMKTVQEALTTTPQSAESGEMGGQMLAAGESEPMDAGEGCDMGAMPMQGAAMGQQTMPPDGMGA